LPKLAAIFEKTRFFKSMLNKVCQFKKTIKLTNNGKEKF